MGKNTASSYGAPTSASRFRNGREIELCRPCSILFYYLRHLRKKNKWTWKYTYDRVSNATSLSPKEIRRIARGQVPNSNQIHLLTKSLRWLICFVFGVEAQVYKETEHIFFYEVGNHSPSLAERREFKKLYIELLLMKIKDEQGGGK